MEGGEYLYHLPLQVEEVTGSGIEVGGIRPQFRVAGHLLECPGPSQELPYIDAGGGNGKEPHRGEDGVPPPHIIGYDKGGVPLTVGKPLEGPPLPVGGNDNPPLQFILVVPLLQYLLQNPEGDGGLSRRPRLGDDIEADPPLLRDIDEVGEVVGAYVLAREVDLRPFLFSPPSAGYGRYG